MPYMVENDIFLTLFRKTECMPGKAKPAFRARSIVYDGEPGIRLQGELGNVRRVGKGICSWLFLSFGVVSGQSGKLCAWLDLRSHNCYQS